MSAQEGLKLDQGKQPWYAMPLAVLRLLADVYRAGEHKYETFNCLKPFKDGDRRFFDGAMRHMEECQIDPLAVDQEILEKYGIKVYHGAQVAFNMLMRTYHAQAAKKQSSVTDGTKGDLI